MKYFFLLLFSLLVVNGNAQSKKADIENAARTLRTNTPPFGLTKINRLLAGMQSSKYPSVAVLDKEVYTELPIREKFTYNMINAESYKQICSFDYYAEVDGTIHAYLPRPFGDLNWSERQSMFFKHNRDTVIKLMAVCIAQDKYIGLNFKHVIVDINATETISLVISAFNYNESDKQLLTVLILLMKQNNFPEFMNSKIYKSLYEPSDSNFRAKIDFNAANAGLILALALKFNNTQHK